LGRHRARKGQAGGKGYGAYRFKRFGQGGGFSF
jgi:hypothetical protein